MIFRTLAASAVFLAAGAHAEITDERIDGLAEAAQPSVVEWRRWFHANPELSNREFDTSARVAEILRGMGLEPRTGIAHTGVVALLEGGKPGPLVAIRADMDALPVTEQTGLPFASTATTEYQVKDEGVMHACGHDSHLAMALGAAQVLSELRDELPGSVLFVFQPAEEGAPVGEEGGAALMIEEGAFEGLDPEAVFGIHVGFTNGDDLIATKPGPMMAASDRFHISVNGRQTHGAVPWNGVDPVVLSAQIIMALQTIPSRQLNVTRAPAVLSVGIVRGGVRYNVIPDSVEMQGTIRSFDPAQREYIHAAIPRTAEAIAASAGATVDVEILPGPRPVINDDDLTAKMMPVLEQVLGGPVGTVLPQTVAEDFSEYGQLAPSLFLFLNERAPGVPAEGQPTNHSPLFNVHEPNMQVGVRAFAHMVVSYLQGR